MRGSLRVSIWLAARHPRSSRSVPRRVGLAVAVASVAATMAAAQQDASRPRPSPGQPTRGFAAVMISTGIDYTRPDVAARLARDGEGEIIGWDAEHRDGRPFAEAGVADRAVALAPVLVVPVRVVAAEPATWAEAFAFLARTPARVVVVAVPDAPAGMARESIARMRALPATLFIVAGAAQGSTARNGTGAPQAATNIVHVDALRPGQPHARAMATTGRADLLVAPRQSLREAPGGSLAPPADAVEAAVLAAGVLACLDLAGAATAADVRVRLIGAARRIDPGLPPVVETCEPADRRRP